MYIVGDIGGTKMRIARSDNARDISGEPVVIPTPPTYSDALGEIVKAAEHMAAGANIGAVAIGIAGVFSADGRSLVGSPNLSDWVGKPVAGDLEDAFRAPVLLANDAAVVGLGEMHYGAGVTDGIGAYVTVSTGVGGARFVDGAIDQATFGFEIGKQIVDIDQSICPDCAGPYLEHYISGGATQKRLGTEAYKIEDQQMWNDYAGLLACGLANSVVHWSPKAIVLGGSMMVGTNGPTISIEKTAAHLRELVTIYPELPELRAATLGDYGGLYGAMVLCRGVES